jgi:predicted DNA-binding protein YlxM (UPF0122 family)
MMHITKRKAVSRTAVIDKIRHSLGILTDQEAELAYVSEAQDRVDLELRLRELDRSNRPLSSYPSYSWKTGF